MHHNQMDDDLVGQKELIELCRLVVERWKVEQAFDRANWQVSYYRKLKAKSENSEKISEKWSEPGALAKKIEQVRLHALQKYEQLVELLKNQYGDMVMARRNLNASFNFDNSRISGIWIPQSTQRWPRPGITLEVNQIVEIVDQHEADTALTKALEDNNKL